MPIDYGASVPADMNEELRDAAMETDEFIGDELAGLIPPFERPIPPKVMDALASAVADAAKVMGMELVIDKYTEPTTELDPDLIRFLAMLGAAAEDYGKPLPPPDSLRAEGDLTRLTAAIIELTRDEGFADFLDMEEEEVEEEVEEVAEEAEDFDFAARMR
jgi:hypothetical protein